MKSLRALKIQDIDIDEARRHFDLPIEDQFSSRRALVAGLSETRSQLIAMLGDADSIPVWRGMDMDRAWAAAVQPGDDVGQSWAWQESGALKGSGLDQSSAATGVVIEATIRDDDVDWETTVAVNTFHPDECEIVLRDGATVELIRILEWPSREVLRDWSAFSQPTP